MTSSYSMRVRLNYQAPGDNVNTWGVQLNSGVFQLLEDTLAGRLALTVSGAVTLTTANGATDQARMAWIDATGSGGTVTIPSVEKTYDVLNGCTGVLIFTCGGSMVATIPAKGRARIVCDGSTVRLASSTEFGGLTLTGVGDPVNVTDAVNLRTLNNTAFQANAGIFPGQASNAGKSLLTDGSNQFWGDPLAPNPARRKALLTNGTALTGLYWSFVGLNGYANVSGAYTPALTDAERVLCFAAGGALPLPAANTMDAGFSFYAKVALAGSAVPVTPNGSDTVDGTAGYPLQPNEMRLFQTDGVSAWSTTIITGYSVVLTSSQTFGVGPGYSRHTGYLLSGGAGGHQLVGPTMDGGPGGGCLPFSILGGAFGASQPITIGAGGAGAATASSYGSAGGTSSIGSLVVVYGGRFSTGGAANAGGGPFPTVEQSGTGDPTGIVFGGGAFKGGVTGDDGTKDGSYGGGAGAYSVGYGGGNSVYGGGGGGGYGPGSTGQGPGVSVFAGSGGAVGGGAGVAPAGGGGSAFNGTAGGNGARGECRMQGAP